jgi:rubrerythrin
MHDSEQFLASVGALESEAARHYEKAARQALAAGDAELEAFFLNLAELARMEAHDALHGKPLPAAVALPRIRPIEIEKPRTAVKVISDEVLDLHLALERALDLKRRSHSYYATMAVLAPDPGLRKMARAFEHDDAAHLAEIEKWIARLTA